MLSLDPSALAYRPHPGAAPELAGGRRCGIQDSFPGLLDLSPRGRLHDGALVLLLEKRGIAADQMPARVVRAKQPNHFLMRAHTRPRFQF